VEEYGSKLDGEALHYLERIRAATQRMGQLIDDLLNLARIGRAPLRRELVDLTGLARRILDELGGQSDGRNVNTSVATGLAALADPRLVAVVLENLLGNAWKFTSKRPDARIEVGQQLRGEETVFFVRDNGAGFEMAYAQRLFIPFQRLHSEGEFEGTGIGLATVQRIVSRHGGNIWAEAEKDRGATLFFTLGDVK
jgi:light-regulated signal transduction histidine kinase (bacteriophytochrome)